MQTCIRRGLYAALFTGGLLVLGTGAASAATPSTDDPLSTNQTSTPITAPVTITTGETEPLEGAPALPSLTGTGTNALTGTDALLAGNQTSTPITAPVTITTPGSLFPGGSLLAPVLSPALINTALAPRTGLTGSESTSPFGLNPAVPAVRASLMLTGPTGYLATADGAGQAPAPAGPGTQTSSGQSGLELPAHTGPSPVTDTRRAAPGQRGIRMAGVMFHLPALISGAGQTGAGADGVAAVPGTGTLADSSGTAVSGPRTVAGSGSAGYDGISGVCLRPAGTVRASAVESQRAPQLAAMVPQSLAFTALALLMLLVALRRNLRVGTVRRPTVSSGGFEAGNQQK